jgi:hypothetical protein
LVDGQIVGEVINQKEKFENDFTKSLASVTLRNIIEKSIPLDMEERGALKNDNFINGLTAVTSKISDEFIDSFDKTGYMSSGSFFDSLIGCIKHNVSIEADNRFQEIIRDIELGKIDITKIGWQAVSEEKFKAFNFTNKELSNHFASEYKAILSMEEENIIESIKNDVKDSVTEAETKNQIVKETVKEIQEVKKELTPPDEAADVTPPDVETSSTPDAKPDSNETNANATDQSAKPTNADGSEATPTEGDTDAKKVSDDTTNDAVVDTKAEPTSAEAIAARIIPIIPRLFKEMTIPNAKEMAVEFARSTGFLNQEIGIRKNALKLAISTENLTDKNEYLEKFDELDKKTTEAYVLSQEYMDNLQALGITQNTRFEKNELSFECAKNIVERFITKTKTVNIYPLPYTSTENIVANAFDIIHLKRMTQENSKDINLFKEYESRESAFYKNMVSIDSPEVKNAALSVLKLGDVKVEDILSPTFVTDYKLDVWDTNFKTIKNKNDLVYDRVSKKLSDTWGRELTKEEQDIIRATTNEEDATEILPTPFEKFIVKFGEEALTASTESGKPFKFSTADTKKIKLKAKLFATITKSLEYLQIINIDDQKELEKYLSI